MPVFKPGIDKLTPEMTGHPILLAGRLEDFGVRNFQMPYVDPAFFSRLWGDDKDTKRIKSWGHVLGKTSPHWISTRNGTPMHIDEGYPRYCVQIQIFNGGFVVHGVDDKIEDMPLFTPGLVTILDGHSPHQVSRDPRLPNLGSSKLAIGMDSDFMPHVEVMLPFMLARIKRWDNATIPKSRRAA